MREERKGQTILWKVDVAGCEQDREEASYLRPLLWNSYQTCGRMTGSPNGCLVAFSALLSKPY